MSLKECEAKAKKWFMSTIQNQMIDCSY